MARLLLAHPMFLSEHPDEVEAASPYFPLGLLSLAAVARDAGHVVEVFDGTFQDSRDRFDEHVAAFGPDVVGLSALLPTRDAAMALARRAHSAGAVTLVGGPDPTADPGAYLDDGGVDLVVHHEGEMTLLAVLDAADRGAPLPEAMIDEPGVALLVDNVPQVNPARGQIADLDSLPPPARDLIDMERYLTAWRDAAGYSSLTVSTSRGCPTGCEWCESSVHGTTFRQRSPADVAAEVAALAATYDIDRFRLVDDVDAIDRTWFEQWADELEAVGTSIGFEALNDLERTDVPLLDVRDSL